MLRWTVFTLKEQRATVASESKKLKNHQLFNDLTKTLGKIKIFLKKDPWETNSVEKKDLFINELINFSESIVLSHMSSLGSVLLVKNVKLWIILSKKSDKSAFTHTFS